VPASMWGQVTVPTQLPFTFSFWILAGRRLAKECGAWRCGHVSFASVEQLTLDSKREGHFLAST
jgi:hypothetical protein